MAGAINPNYKKGNGQSAPKSPEAWLELVRHGGMPGLSRAISLLENHKQEARSTANALLDLCLPYSGKSLRLGITGIPGAGKSTYIEQAGQYWLQKGYRMAILAVDPSSQRTGGSILGDKTRMEHLSRNPEVFIRPSASAGALGGVGLRTREAMLLCEAAGYDLILVETVGVGQSEIAVHSMVDLFTLIAIPGAGDELQGIKRGIMEMADTILINKAEPPAEQKAKMAAAELRNALHLFPKHPYGMEPQVLLMSALKNQGIKASVDHLESMLLKARDSGAMEKRRKDQAVFWFQEALQGQWEHILERNSKVHQRYLDLKAQVSSAQMSPFLAAQQLWAELVSAHGN